MTPDDKDAVLDLARANLARADLTPADMEAVVARLEVAAIDPAPWPDLRALLKAYQEQRRALEAASPAQEVEAWRTVPVEPTEAMIEAAHALWGEGTGVNYVQLEPEDFYAAMLAASPVVPVGVSRETLLKAVRPVLDRHPMIDSSQSHKLDIQAGWVADAILAALRPTDTGRE